MSVRFVIKDSAKPAEKEGDSFVRFTGRSEVFTRGSERDARVVETNEKGDPTKFHFVTGLEEDQVEFYKWFTEDERTVIKESIEELKPTIEKYYGGKALTNPTNYSFWKKREEINKFVVSPVTREVTFDTKDPKHALLYLSIMAGAFMDVVAPNQDWAIANRIPHYVALETEVNFLDDEDEITRSDAHAELGMLRKEFGKDALYTLAWCLQHETNGYGAYSYRTSEKDLIQYHIKYIDGKLKTKKKTNFAKKFIEYAEKWRAPLTRPALQVEAYVIAGEYFSFINQKEKKYTTADGSILGNTIEDAVKSLMKKPSLKVDLEKLRDQVEAKWKE